jgi:hypothetical protein
MMHHPTLGSAGHASLADEASDEEAVNRFVHGALIALMLVYFTGASLLARKLGRGRPLVAGGEIAIGLATFLLVLAALMSGFVTTELAHHFAPLPGGGGDDFRNLILLTGAFNQVFANAATAAYGAGTLLLSIPLIARDRFGRLAGAIGAVIGVVIFAGMTTGHIRLDVHGMTLVIAGIGLWYALVGVLLAKGELSAA